MREDYTTEVLWYCGCDAFFRCMATSFRKNKTGNIKVDIPDDWYEEELEDIVEEGFERIGNKKSKKQTKTVAV